MTEEIQKNIEQQAETAQEIQESLATQDNTAKLEEEVARLKDLYLRAMAETENVRARAKRENEDTAKYAATKFARDMVNVLENLMRASGSITLEHRAADDVVKGVGEGIDMTVQELVGIFDRNGIKRIDPVGQKFDHNYHQAVAQVESTDATPGTVVQVLQAGYVMHDRLLRPAMVSVAKEATNSDATSDKVA